MVYTEIQERGNKKYYYLVQSIREGSEVKKRRKYLGADLSSTQLKKLQQKHTFTREKTPYNLITPQSIPQLTKEHLHFLKQLKNKKFLSAKQFTKHNLKQFIILFTYDTNAIEGSTLTQREVKNILTKNTWPRDANRTDISETYGVSEAIDYLLKTKEHLTLRLIKKLHHITFKNSKDFAGKLRKRGEEVVIGDGFGTIVHRGAPSHKVEQLLQEIVQWYGKNQKKYHPLILAAIVHDHFETIHPFKDGNGRVGRLLLNNILIKNGLPFTNVGFKTRRRYYRTLQAYQHRKDLRPTISFLIQSYKHLLKKYEPKKQ